MRFVIALLCLIALAAAQTSPPKCYYFAPGTQQPVTVLVGTPYTDAANCKVCSCVSSTLSGASTYTIECVPTTSGPTCSSPTTPSPGTTQALCMYNNAAYPSGQCWTTDASGCTTCCCSGGSTAPLSVSCRSTVGVACPTTTPTAAPPKRQYTLATAAGALSYYDIGYQYTSSDGCSVCVCVDPSQTSSSSTASPYFRCSPSSTAPVSCTTPPTCTTNAGAVVSVGTVVNEACITCTCSLDANDPTKASMVCTTLASTTVLTGSSCGSTPAPPTVCPFAGVTYAVNANFIDSSGCQNCTCQNSGAISCTPVASCTSTPVTQQTCSVGGTTLQVGQELVISSCRRCKCTVSGTGTATSPSVAQLVCTSDTTCFQNHTCEIGTTSFAQGAVYHPDPCHACTCDTTGWICNPTPTVSGCSSGTPPGCQVPGAAPYPQGSVVRFDPCTNCSCVCDPTSNTAACQWRCSAVAACVTPTYSTPAATATAPATTLPPVTTTAQQFCTDNNGNGFVVGASVPSKDGCGVCVCSQVNALGTAASSPAWVCRPVDATDNAAPCCNLNGVSLRPGSSVLDVTTGKNCTCGLGTGLSCVTPPTGGVCTTSAGVVNEGEKIIQGCNTCTCTNGRLICTTNPCTINCISVQVTVTLQNTATATNFISTAFITARLNAEFGAGKYTIVSVTSDPSTTVVVVDLNCVNTDGSSADAGGSNTASVVTSGFVSNGASNAQSNYQVTNDGSAASAASAVFVNFGLVLCAALLALVATMA